MTVVSKSHIALNDQGHALITGTRTKVSLIVRDRLHGMTPEQIHQTYPNLSLAQIHAARAFYYDNKAAMNAQIEHENREVDALRAASKQPPRAAMEQRLKQRRRASL